MKQNPHVEEARKERESKLSLPSSFSPGNVGKESEYTQEELDKYLEKLNHVFSDTAVQQAVDTDLSERRHQCQSAFRRYHKQYQ